MRGISGLAALIRDSVETRNGRIRWYPFKHYFVGTMPKRSNALLNWKKEPWPISRDADDKEFSTVKGSSALCFNYNLWIGTVPRLLTDGNPVRSRFYVPANSCKECQYHVKAKQVREAAVRSLLVGSASIEENRP